MRRAVSGGMRYAPNDRRVIPLSRCLLYIDGDAREAGGGPFEEATSRPWSKLFGCRCHALGAAAVSLPCVGDSPNLDKVMVTTDVSLCRNFVLILSLRGNPAAISPHDGDGRSFPSYPVRLVAHLEVIRQAAAPSQVG
jgi:hypothetical protein